MDEFDRGLMLETFIHEMGTLVDQLENTMIQTGETYTMNTINEIFRVMHTIKGSASMMLFTVLADVTHVAEDIFFFLRENNPEDADYPTITDLVLEVVDFVKLQLAYMESEEQLDDHPEDLIERLKVALAELKGGGAGGSANAPTTPVAQTTGLVLTGDLKSYTAKVFFQEDSQMENVRAFTIMHNMQEMATDITTIPDNVLDEGNTQTIRNNGFIINFKSNESLENIRGVLLKSIYIRDLHLEEVDGTNITADTPSFSGGNAEMNTFEVTIKFQKETQMENVRAFAVINNIPQDLMRVIKQSPEDLLDETSSNVIVGQGFKLTIETALSYAEVEKHFEGTIYLEELSVVDVTGPKKAEDLAGKLEPEVVEAIEAPEAKKPAPKKEVKAEVEPSEERGAAAQKKPAASINVSVRKLDDLLNLVGELVISEAMVTQNPELEGLDLENFTKESRQLRKIIVEVQHTVTSMRMVPLTQTFFKMNRIVRDMCRQLNKNVQLEVIGDETEVDKNIIEHIADPLMHIIRNSVDHGIEMPEDRLRVGKREQGTVTLEAKNSGGDVFIIIRDDGAGFKKDKILQKARENGMLTKPEEEYTEREIYQFIFKPGFSTNEQVTSYSGRGVGMDVVNTNLDHVGGSVIADSVEGEGSSITLKIPLTLAIIEGMLIRIGEAKYAIPIMDIKRSLKIHKEDIVFDPNNNEMVKIRGEVYNLVRLNKFFGLDMGTDDIEEGIVLMLENGDNTVCVFADELIGEQQIVVKNIPKYIKKVQGLSGCTLLGNGDISLIINVAAFFDR